MAPSHSVIVLYYPSIAVVCSTNAILLMLSESFYYLIFFPLESLIAPCSCSPYIRNISETGGLDPQDRSQKYVFQQDGLQDGRFSTGQPWLRVIGCAATGLG